MKAVKWTTRRTGWTDDGVAAAYDARRFGSVLGRRKHANDARIVVSLLARVGSGLRVLDAPTGTGRMVGDLVEAGHRVVGVDLSEAMLARGNSPAASFEFPGNVAAEIERLPFPDDTFDAAVALRFLFHVRDGEVRHALLTELRRVAPWLVGHERAAENVKHAGRFLRSRIGLRSRYRPAPRRADLTRELESAGWTLVAAPPVSRLFSDKRMFLARRST